MFHLNIYGDINVNVMLITDCCLFGLISDSMDEYVKERLRSWNLEELIPKLEGIVNLSFSSLCVGAPCHLIYIAS